MIYIVQTKLVFLIVFIYAGFTLIFENCDVEKKNSLQNIERKWRKKRLTSFSLCWKVVKIENYVFKINGLRVSWKLKSKVGIIG